MTSKGLPLFSSKVMPGKQILKEKIFASHKVKENLYLAIVNPNGNPHFEDFKVWPRAIGFGNPHFADYSLKAIFLNYMHQYAPIWMWDPQQGILILRGQSSNLWISQKQERKKEKKPHGHDVVGLYNSNCWFNWFVIWVRWVGNSNLNKICKLLYNVVI